MPAEGIAEAIDLVRRRRRMDQPIDAYLAAGMSRATAYRRMAKPEALTFREILDIAEVLGVPAPVLVGGEMATMRWLLENATGPTDDGGASGRKYAPRDSNPEPAGSAPALHPLHPRNHSIDDVDGDLPHAA